MTEKGNVIIKPNKYHNGKIYTIRCRDDDNLIYVGSSCLPLHKRFYQHKQFMKKDKHKNTLIYIKMNELGSDKFYIELYELYKCNTKEELNKREGEIIREISTLNMRIEGRTKQEYYNDNKEHITERTKKYYYANQERNLKYQKQHYDKNKERILGQIKHYQIQNKDKILEGKKKYYEEHKQQKKEVYKTNKETIKCGCGCEVVKQALQRHQKSQKHLSLLEQLNTSNNEVV